jgi:hypothetical protein
MKVKFGSRCVGQRRPTLETMEVPDDTTDEELEEMANEMGCQNTGYECWYEKE